MYAPWTPFFSQKSLWTGWEPLIPLGKSLLLFLCHAAMKDVSLGFTNEAALFVMGDGWFSVIHFSSSPRPQSSPLVPGPLFPSPQSQKWSHSTVLDDELSQEQRGYLLNPFFSNETCVSKTRKPHTLLCELGKKGTGEQMLQQSDSTLVWDGGKGSNLSLGLASTLRARACTPGTHSSHLFSFLCSFSEPHWESFTSWSMVDVKTWWLLTWRNLQLRPAKEMWNMSITNQMFNA